MKCKYCKCKLNLWEWITQLGTCVSCQTYIWTKEWEIKNKASKEYWEDKKQDDLK